MSEETVAVDAAGVGPTFLFEHGLCGDAAQTADVFPPDARWRRVTLEMPGHGRSPPAPPEILSIARFAGIAARWLEENERAPAVVGGISMGAAIGLRLAVRRPDLVRALVLARPAWLFAPAPGNLVMYREVAALIASHPPDEGRAIFATGATAAGLARDAPDNLATMLGLFVRTPRDATRDLLARIPADGPGVSEAEAARIAMPTLVIGTARDSAHPIAYARQLAKTIPGARFVEVTSKADDKDRYRADFRAALSAFLKDLER